MINFFYFLQSHSKVGFTLRAQIFVVRDFSCKKFYKINFCDRIIYSEFR